MKRSIFKLFAAVLLVSACNKMSPDDMAETYYPNTFAYNIMNTYYLWNEEPEVAAELESWSTKEDPFEKMEKTTYEADKWTKLYSDYTPFESTVTGSGKTYGLEYGAFYANEDRTRVIGVVYFTYADSPAREAGLQRGDVITTIDGESMTPDTYRDILSKLYTTSSITLGLEDGRTIPLTAVKMYENPVHTVCTFDHNGKKMGYLHFTNFTLDACKDLETAFAQFKADGIKELVLDLRYNTGGYAFTSVALASMIAPVSVVSKKEVFNRDIYNENLADDEDDITTFQTELTYTSVTSGQKVTVKPLDVNPGIDHLWVLVTGNSASASEALICGLVPYMNVTLVGKQTYGKFCGGNLIKAKDWFDAVEKNKGLKNFDYDAARAAMPLWGIYVITSRYADCDGVTLSMPDGIPVDLDSKDYPLDGYELGDPLETMLAAALDAVKSAPATPDLLPVENPVRRPGFGVLLH